MSGGRRIDDHKFFGGSGSKDSVFPKGVHTKEEHSAMSAGAEHEYEDTTEAIRSQQEMGSSKAKSHPLKANYRN
jgi:hypothetical protein